MGRRSPSSIALPKKVKHQVSAGGVIFRKVGEAVEGAGPSGPSGIEREGEMRR